MRYIFIINPVAGNGKGIRLKQPISEYCEKNKLSYNIYITKGPRDATNITRFEASKGDNVNIYSCGGDGTLNEVVEGAKGFANASIGAFPCGTGNDFIEGLNKAELFMNIESQIAGRSRPVDIIQYNDKYCINIFSAGFDAEVAYNMNKFKKYPLIGGRMAYSISILYCLLKKIRHRLEVNVDGSIVTGDFLLVLAGNGSRYGGGFRAAPNAVLDDGMLELILIKSVSRFKIISLLNKFKNGNHLDIKDIVIYKRGKSISIKSQQPLSFNIDGECERGLAANGRILEKSLSFIIPKGAE